MFYKASNCLWYALYSWQWTEMSRPKAVKTLTKRLSFCILRISSSELKKTFREAEKLQEKVIKLKTHLKFNKTCLIYICTCVCECINIPNMLYEITNIQKIATIQSHWKNNKIWTILLNCLLINSIHFKIMNSYSFSLSYLV